MPIIKSNVSFIIDQNWIWGTSLAHWVEQVAMCHHAGLSPTWGPLSPCFPL